MCIYYCFIFTEQATVKAKQYIRTNITNIRDESQGVELEFLCRDLPASSSSASVLKTSIENELDQFRGFDSSEKERAEMIHQNFLEKVNEQNNISAEKRSKIFLANVIISDACRRSGKPFNSLFDFISIKHIFNIFF